MNNSPVSLGSPTEPKSRWLGPVLIVDDDPLLTEALGALFRLRDISYTVAGNGQEALLAIAKEPPALLFLDLNMPLLDGPGVMRAVQREGYCFPIVAMSSEPNLPSIAAAWGLVSYLSKPFSVIEVLNLVDSLCAA